jgi:PAS domain S-box-containing protein
MKYRQLIEEARDAIVVVDRHGIVHEWNPQASQFFGFSRDEVLGRPLPTLPSDTQEDFFCLLERLATGHEESELKYASQRLTKRGEVVDVSLSLFPLRDERGEVATFLETSCDIRACAQLVRKMQQVEKMSAMGQLAAGVAHQLNTPLGSALLRTQMLEEDVQNPEQLEDLQFIQRQVCYGKEIVESLLRFSRPSREIKRTERLNPILQGVLCMMAPTVRNKKVQLVHDLRATEGALVYVGRNELEQVFVNLRDNALDAMPQGGELTLSTQVQQERSIVIHVRDTGTGMPHVRLLRIFEPFYTTKEPGKGTGLGLAICRRIIDDAGGTIEAASELGQGTTFTIRLPLAGMVPEALPSAPAPQGVAILERISAAPHATQDNQDNKDHDDGPVGLHSTVEQCTCNKNGGPARLLRGMLPSNTRRGEPTWTPQPYSARIWHVLSEARSVRAISLATRARSSGLSVSSATKPSRRRKARSATGCVRRLNWS